MSSRVSAGPPWTRSRRYLDRIFAPHIFRNRRGAARRERHQRVIAGAIAYAFLQRQLLDFEVHAAPGLGDVTDPATHDHPVSPTERTLILDVRRVHEPAEPPLCKFLHAHPVV